MRPDCAPGTGNLGSWQPSRLVTWELVVGLKLGTLFPNLQLLLVLSVHQFPNLPIYQSTNLPSTNERYTMTIKRIDHIAIVVEDLDAALGVYRDALGMTVSDVQEMPEQDVKMAFLPAGDSEIELLEPISADSGIGKYLAEARGGVAPHLPGGGRHRGDAG